VTDVTVRFPRRSRSDGHYYVVDFDLDEIRTLRVTERVRPGTTQAVFPQRFPTDTLGFRVATLTEEIQLIQGLNRSTNRQVGLYPEIKHPAWHRAHGIDLTRLLLETLTTFGYEARNDPVFVQCFDADELRRLRYELACELKLTQLISEDAEQPRGLTAAGLATISEYADGMGVEYQQLVTPPVEGEEGMNASPLVDRIRNTGLLLHPFTFRRDELPSFADSFEQLLQFFFTDVGVDAIFCDHPDVALEVRNSVSKARRQARPTGLQ
jgi:glycerophosphoryl diester phosphodiesterase